MNFFEDFVVGTRVETGSHAFTADEIKAFAGEFDPQSFHLDEAAAARSHFGGLIASGWHTAAVCLRLLVEDRHRRQAELRMRGEAVARTGPSPGLRNVQWPHPVYAGDLISYAHEIVALRDATDRAGCRAPGGAQYRHQPERRARLFGRDQHLHRTPQQAGVRGLLQRGKRGGFAPCL